MEEEEEEKKRTRRKRKKEGGRRASAPGGLFEAYSGTGQNSPSAGSQFKPGWFEAYSGAGQQSFFDLYLRELGLRPLILEMRA